jgi:acetoin utilization deacetylase AcuC-like enzyme
VTLWPGTGLPAEAGGPEAVGSAVNVALPAATTDAGWLRAFHALVPPLLREFRRAARGAKFTVERMLSVGCDGFGGQPSFAA